MITPNLPIERYDIQRFSYFCLIPMTTFEINN